MNNLFDIGDTVYYLFMDSVCKSMIKDFRIVKGEYVYSDNIFDNLKECYLFDCPKKCIKFHEKKHRLDKL